MKQHTKIYIQFFGYDVQDFMPCELLGVRSCDVHHIENRGAGGTTTVERIENLMGLERTVHLIYGDKAIHMEFLREAHRLFMRQHTPYVEINPYHTAFDLLEGTAYETKVLHERSIIDELNKYKI